MKRMLAILLTLCLAFAAMTVTAFAADDKTIADFKTDLEADGIVEGGTYVWTIGTDIVAHEGVNPNRLNSKNAQYFLLEGSDKAAVIKNATFTFTAPEDSVRLDHGTWVQDSVVNCAQLYLETTGDVTFENCTFNGVIATSFNCAGKTTFSGCVFNDATETYAIKDARGAEIEITGCTFNNCSGAVMVSAVAADTAINEVSITGNTFNGVGERGMVQLASSGVYAEDALTFTGNTATNSGPVFRDLNSTANTSSVTAEDNNGMEITFKGDSYAAVIGTAKYQTLEAAVANAKPDDVITLRTDAVLSAQLTLPSGVVLDGAGHTVSGSGTWATGNDAKYLIVASGEGTGVKNITLNPGAGDGKFGLQFYCVKQGTLENVTVENFPSCGLQINASQVTATGTLTLRNCGWGNAINVGYGTNIPADAISKFDVSAATVSCGSIYSDAGDNERAQAAGTKNEVLIPDGWNTVTANGQTTSGKAALTATDCGHFVGATWAGEAGAFSFGWQYEFIGKDSIESIRVGCKDQYGRIVIEKTAKAEQITYQKANGYVTDAGLSSTPFYKTSSDEALSNSEALAWTTTSGEGYNTWQPSLFYVEVVANGVTYNAEMAYDYEYTHIHEAKHVDEVLPTHTSHGVYEHWYCALCDTYFDMNSENPELPGDVCDAEYVVNESLGHGTRMDYKPLTPATHTANGNIEYYYCSECEKYYEGREYDAAEIPEEAIVIRSSGHIRAEKVEGKPATHTEDGVMPYYHCDFCDKDYFGREYDAEEVTSEADLVIPALGHSTKMDKIEGKPATHAEDGTYPYYYCSVCNEYYFGREADADVVTDENKVIPAEGHIRATKVDAKAATCTEDGNVEYWYCVFCDKNFDGRGGDAKELTNVVIPATGHKNVGEGEATEAGCHTWGNVAYKYCFDCGKYLDMDGKVIENIDDLYIAPENELEWNEEVKATNKAEGMKAHWYCAGCGKYYVETEEGLEEVTKASLIIPKTTTPATGDNTALVALVTLAILGSMGIAVVTVMKKRAIR